MSCVTVIPDPTRPQVFRQLVETDIEEIATRLRLRDEVIALHTNFSIRERFSGSIGTQPGNRTSGYGTMQSM